MDVISMFDCMPLQHNSLFSLLKVCPYAIIILDE